MQAPRQDLIAMGLGCKGKLVVNPYLVVSLTGRLWFMEVSGYSGTPLEKKLGFKEGQKVVLANPPEHYFSLLGDLPGIEILRSPTTGSADLIHLFCTSRNDLASNFPVMKHYLKKTGMLWVSWPKRSSGMASDIDGNYVRGYGLSQGLVDVKVCAVDANWSGLKFMYRKKDRT